MTGTGNTARAAGVIADELTGAGWCVTTQELRKGAEFPRGVFTGDLLVLCFPTLGFGMPSMVRQMLKGLRGAGKPAAVFATWGGEGSAAVWQGRGFLRRRGFDVIAVGGAAYPFQWTQVFAPPAEKEAHGMIETGDEETGRFAKELAAGLADGHRKQGQKSALSLHRFVSVLFGLLIAYLYSWIGRSGLAALYAADNRCKACGRCALDCPAGAIVMAGKGPARRPRWSGRCQGCNRCINLCARGAVQSSPLRAAVHLTLNVAVIAAIVVGLNRAAALAAAPALISVPAYVAALIASMVIGSRLQFRVLEPVLFVLESAPGPRALIARTWTARFPRYRCEGFAPKRAVGR